MYIYMYVAIILYVYVHVIYFTSNTVRLHKFNSCSLIKGDFGGLKPPSYLAIFMLKVVIITLALVWS